MSDDLTEQLPGDPRDTTPILERLVEEVRLMRDQAHEDALQTRQAVARLTERVDRLEHKVEEGFTDTRADLARTRSSLREDALVEARTNEARLTAIERRLKALEESRRPA